MQSIQTLDVWSDIACPWCWIGHARLRRALAEEPAGSVVVVPRAFELQPGLPPEGVPFDDFLVQRFGSADRTGAMFTRVAEEGAKDGLELRIDRTVRAPNTRAGHRLVWLAGQEGRGLEALDALFAAHHRDGLDVSDPAVASGIVRDATGLDLADALAAGGGEEQVAEDEAMAAAIGVTGVPCFVVLSANTGISGAQEPDVLRRLLAAGREAATA